MVSEILGRPPVGTKGLWASSVGVGWGAVGVGGDVDAADCVWVGGMGVGGVLVWRAIDYNERVRGIAGGEVSGACLSLWRREVFYAGHGCGWCTVGR